MADPFLSEIRAMSFAYPPRGWALCNGQLLPINQNEALFALLGTTFGGDGQVNFALPNLQGRTPIHVGSSRELGDAGGEQAHVLSMVEMPMHTHVLYGANNPAIIDSPASDKVLGTASIDMYRAPSNLVAMDPATIESVGGNQAHLNMQPFLALSFCIALEGIAPEPNPHPPT